MSTDIPDRFVVSPDDIQPRPDLNYPAERADLNELVTRKWTSTEVELYREALIRLGLTSEALEDLIERDCGREFCRRPMLLVRQAV